MNKIKCFNIIILFIFMSSLAVAQDEDSLKLLSLEDCVMFAARSSYEVRLAQLDYLIAETDLDDALSVFDAVLSAEINYEDDRRDSGSVFAATRTETNEYSADITKTLPSGTEITMSASDERTRSNSAYVADNSLHDTEAGVEVRQPIAKNLFGANDRRDVLAARLDIKNADLDTKDRIENLFTNVEKAYWEWTFYKKNLNIFKDMLDKAKKLDVTNAKNYDVGRIEKADYLASQANVKIREKDVVAAENSYRRAEEKIKLLMNMDAGFRVSPKGDLKYRIKDVDLSDCLKKAFKKRRDYQTAKRNLEIKDVTLQTKENEQWPVIDLVASLAANGVDPRFGNSRREITSENNTDYYVGIEISVPLENRKAKSQFRKAQHDKEKSIIKIKDIERKIVTEIGDSFRDYITYESNLKNLMVAANLQHEKLTEEEKRYNYGRSNTKTLIDYQQDYLQADLDVAKGMLKLEKARVELEKSTNLILEKYEGLL